MARGSHQFLGQAPFVCVNFWIPRNKIEVKHVSGRWFLCIHVQNCRSGWSGESDRHEVVISVQFNACDEKNGNLLRCAELWPDFIGVIMRSSGSGQIKRCPINNSRWYNLAVGKIFPTRIFQWLRCRTKYVGIRTSLRSLLKCHEHPRKHHVAFAKC